MANVYPTQVGLFGSAPKTAAAPSRALRAVNKDRRSRFDARAARRWGDWSPYLEFPFPLLWLDDDFGPCLYDECEFVWPEVIELWP
jgi:hypothetical protein